MTFPSAFTIALPLAPLPSGLPIKSTFGGPHRRTFVLQSGFEIPDGLISGIKPSSPISISGISGSNPPAKPFTASKGLVIEFKFAIPSILLKLSSPAIEVPDLDEKLVFGGQFCESQSRVFVRRFAN